MLEDYDHFNPACHLAPVGSPLVIKVKGPYTRICPEGKLENLHLEIPQQVKVKRVRHIRSKNDEMVYQEPDGTLLYGRFEWTHA